VKNREVTLQVPAVLPLSRNTGRTQSHVCFREAGLEPSFGIQMLINEGCVEANPREQTAAVHSNSDHIGDQGLCYRMESSVYPLRESCGLGPHVSTVAISQSFTMDTAVRKKGNYW
jgi:hypothetical protein